MKDSALVVVDMLNDFIDGTMACKNAEEAIASSLAFIEKETAGLIEDKEAIQDSFPIIFVRDFHPSDHSSFQAQGGPWPSHCVKHTPGAEIHKSLRPYATEELTFFKGYDKEKEEYSGFNGKNEGGQSLQDVLSIMDIKNVFVCGIATEYCVKNTCLDLMKAGFTVWLLQDGLAYVSYEGHIQALKEMEEAGVKLMNAKTKV